MANPRINIPDNLSQYLATFGTSTNLNSTTPAAPGGKANVAWQSDEFGNISANVSSGGGGGTTFGPADYGVTQANTFTFPDEGGDFDVSANNVNLTSDAATNISAGGSLDVQATGSGALLISTNNGNLAITGGASGDAVDITAPGIGSNLSISAGGNVSIDASGTLEMSGAIQVNGQTTVAAGNSTALIVKEGAAQSQNLVSFANHSGTFVSGVNKTGDLVLSGTTGAPSDTPVTNTMRFDNAASKLWVYNGTAWVGTVLS